MLINVGDSHQWTYMRNLGGGGGGEKKSWSWPMLFWSMILKTTSDSSFDFFFFIFWRTSIVVLLTIPYIYETFNYGALTQKNWSLLWCQTKSTSMYLLYTQLNKIKIGEILVYLANTQCLNFFLTCLVIIMYN